MNKIEGTELCPSCNIERDFEYEVGGNPYFKCECYKLIVVCSLCECIKCTDCYLGSNFKLAEDELED